MATLPFLIQVSLKTSLSYEDQLVPLLSILQVGETLKGNLTEDGKSKVLKKGDRSGVGGRDEGLVVWCIETGELRDEEYHGHFV